MVTLNLLSTANGTTTSQTSGGGGQIVEGSPKSKGVWGK